MKKINISLAMLFIAATQTTQAQIHDPAPYCVSKYYHNYNMFNNIKIKGTTLSFGAMGTWTDNNDYNYYNNFVFPNLKKGDTASIELNVYAVNDGEPVYFALWIDYNRNDSFEDSEIVMQNSNTTSAYLPTFGAATPPITKVITIPATAVAGKTRARLLRSQDPNFGSGYNPALILSSCHNEVPGQFGNTYDLDINITDASTSVGNTEAAYVDDLFHPNPATERITLAKELLGADISILDAQGRVVYFQQHVSEVNVDITSLQAGIYYVRAMSGDVLNSQKLMVIK